MDIISWNVNGIRSVLKKGFTEWLTRRDPDVLCLQETRALVEQVPLETQKPEGYFAYWFPAEKKGYSGVATFSKFPADEVLYGWGEDEYDGEGRLLQTRFGQLVLMNGYFPNGGSKPERLEYKMKFYDAFLKVSETWRAKGFKVVTCGDFNTCHREIDIARPKENAKVSGFLPMEREWIDQYLAKGYVDSFRHFHPQLANQYTWWSNRGGARERNVGWRIDYFFVNQEMIHDLEGAYIFQEDLGSDHCPLGIRLKNV